MGDIKTEDADTNPNDRSGESTLRGRALDGSEQRFRKWETFGSRSWGSGSVWTCTFPSRKTKAMIEPFRSA